MSESPTYQVAVGREPRRWTATVTNLPGVHTWARTLPALDGHVREAIALALELPEGAETGLDVAYDYQVGPPDLDAATAELRRDRAALVAAERKLTVRSAAAAEILTAQLGLSVRDAGIILGVSGGRVSQLAPRPRA